MEDTVFESTGPVVTDDSDLQVLIVGIPWKSADHSGFIIQRGYGALDDGWGYCIDTEKQVTHYGGIAEFEAAGNEWRFRLDPKTAAEMDLPPHMIIRFDAEATADLDATAALVRSMIGPDKLDRDHT